MMPLSLSDNSNKNSGQHYHHWRNQQRQPCDPSSRQPSVRKMLPHHCLLMNQKSTSRIHLSMLLIILFTIILSNKCVQSGHAKIKVWRGPTKGDVNHRTASFGYWFHHDGPDGWGGGHHRGAASSISHASSVTPSAAGHHYQPHRQAHGVMKSAASAANPDTLSTRDQPSPGSGLKRWD